MATIIRTRCLPKINQRLRVLARTDQQTDARLAGGQFPN